ncbi:tape measure protein [Psychrobacillus sp.]|uniref:tape measure protein n=1 Tax=Psychrobacillus sp. TaxID=1871623 RepID=UPI0028BE7313|nr:tape measure protein [Psychrobacillus sp.]
MTSEVTVRTTIDLVDNISGPLDRINKRIGATIQALNKLSGAANKSFGSMQITTQRTSTALLSASTATKRLAYSTTTLTSSVSQVNLLSQAFRNITPAVQQSLNGINRISNALGKLVSVQDIMDGAKAFVTNADTYATTSARLGTVNDGSQSDKELMDKVYSSAQRSGSGIADTANNVASINSLAPDAFSSNDEAIYFTELMSKAFTASGTSPGDSQAGMQQIIQAMGSGQLHGPTFSKIMNEAPLLAQAIAQATGKSTSDLKDMAANGQITADVIKNSLFSAADGIEEKFNKMPRTAGQAWTMFKNFALASFAPLFQRFSSFMNSEAFTNISAVFMYMVGIFTSGLNVLFDAFEWLYGLINSLAPILYPIAAVIGVIVSILLIKYAVIGMISAATMAWAAIQWVVSAAYLSNPIVWVLLAIVAVIVFVIYAMIAWQDQTAIVVGFIVGLFAAFGAYIWNTIASIWNVFAMFAEFLINLFIDPTYAMQKLFYDMVKMAIDQLAALGGSFDTVANVLGKAFVAGANIAIGAVNGLIKALNLIPGVDLKEIGKLNIDTANVVSNGLKNLATNLEAPTSSKNVVSLQRMEMANMPAAFNAGNALGKAASKAASDKLSKGFDKVKDKFSHDESKENPYGKDGYNKEGLNIDPSTTGLGANPDGKLKGGKLDSVGKIDGQVNVADENIKLMRELAEIKSIQNFVTLTPTVQMTAGDIKNGMDLEDVVKRVEKAMEEEITRSAEGVFR